MSSRNSPKRAFHWDRVKGLRAKSAIVIATSLGAGLAPEAPGTMGTLVGIPIAYFTNDWETTPRVLLWGGLFAIGTWSAKVFDEIMQTGDNQNIVIDETVGLGITAWTAGTHPWTLFSAFVLFRAFDIIKPPPVRQLDAWSKHANKKSAWFGGFGVMADDGLAALQALIVILVLQHFQILP